MRRRSSVYALAVALVAAASLAPLFFVALLAPQLAECMHTPFSGVCARSVAYFIAVVGVAAAGLALAAILTIIAEQRT